MDHRPRPHLRPAAWIFAVITLPLSVSHAQIQRVSSDDSGRSTFIAKGCAGCHSVYGYGPGGAKPEGGPDLGKREVYGTYMELAASMWNHFPDMIDKARKQGKQFPSFTEAEVADVVSFLAFIRYTGQPGHERAGRKLLREKNCTKCHTFGGQGGDIGPDFTDGKDYLSPLSLAVAMWNHGPGMMELFRENDVERPRLNGREIVDMSVGIRSFMMPSRMPPETSRPGNPATGSLLVDVKRCNFCHGGPKGRTDGPADFREMRLDASVTEIAGNMWNHGPMMWEMMEEKGVEFPTLTAVEMADIIAFLYELKLKDPVGDAGRGVELVDEKGCINCHSIDGKGAHIGPEFSEIGSIPSPLSMISLMWNHAEDMNEAAREQGKRWPKFSGAELADIYAYLRTIADSQQPQ